MGLVEAWDGRIVPAVWLDPSDRVYTRAAWRAHLRVVMPLVDDQRARIAEYLPKYLSTSALRELGNADGACELGPMRHAVINWRVNLPKGERLLLDLLVDVRNDLAHSRPAKPERLETLLKLLGLR